MLSKCPICKVKFLVGGHQIKCMKTNPKAWFEHLQLSLRVSRDRPGRIGLLKR